jgi:hypothetical protein
MGGSVLTKTHVWRELFRLESKSDRAFLGRRDERFFCGTKQKSGAIAGLNDRERKRGYRFSL